MISPYPARISLIRKQLPLHQLSGLVISKRENIHYLIGLIPTHPTNREALLLITPDQTVLYHSVFITPPRFPWLKTFPMSKNLSLPALADQIFATGSSLGIEGNNLTVNEWQNLNQTSHFHLICIPFLVETLRQIKSTTEIQKISQASLITQKTMAWVTKYLTQTDVTNFTETSLSHLIEQKFYQFGADGLAFPTIVAFNQNSASPHHLPQKTKLTPRSIILLDFGCNVDGYASDMTRTVCLGTPPPRFLEIEKIVHSAYSAALTLLSQHFRVTELTCHPTPGLKQLKAVNTSEVKALEIDHAARSVINQAGYGSRFIHTTGHSLGLEIHEQPSINPQNNLPLKPGMVITIEPGIYLPRRFGYRHENTILLT